MSACREENASILEFRADGDYATISFKFAPSTQTDDSSKIVTVALYNNQDIIDSKEVEYGKYNQFPRTRISDVSALKIKVWTELNSKGGCSGTSLPVLFDINVTPN